MVDLMCRLSNLLFFGIPLLYYVSLNSSIIFCLSFEEIYLSFGISLLTSFDCISSLCDFFDALVILSAILLPIKSPVVSALLLTIFFNSNRSKIFTRFYCFICLFFTVFTIKICTCFYCSISLIFYHISYQTF